MAGHKFDRSDVNANCKRVISSRASLYTGDSRDNVQDAFESVIDAWFIMNTLHVRLLQQEQMQKATIVTILMDEILHSASKLEKLHRDLARDLPELVKDDVERPAYLVETREPVESK